MKDQYAELILDVCAPHLIVKAELSCPPKESTFSHLYLQSYSFGHDQNMLPFGEGWKEAGPVNGKLAFRLSSLFTSTDRRNTFSTSDEAPIHLSFFFKSVHSLNHTFDVVLAHGIKSDQ